MDKKIVSLLENNLRVIIPDFGAFIIRQQEPRIVVFNEMLTNNDGLLIDYIIRTENAEPEMAKQQLSDFTSQALRILDAGGVFTIAGLGTLQKDKIGNVIFTQDSPPTEKAPFAVTPEQPSEIIEKSHDVIKAPEHEIIFRKPAYEEPALPKNIAVVSRPFIRWILIILAANIAVFLFFLLRDNKGHLYGKNKKASVIDESVLDQLADSMMAAVADTTLVYDPVSEEKPVNKEIPTDANPGIVKFYIVAGCFRDEVNADELVDSLKLMGYKAEKFGRIGDLYAVSFASFDEKEIAVKELARIRRAHHPDAWMTRF